MHVGFTGTQQGMTDSQKAELRRLFANHEGVFEFCLGPIHFHHGDCIGADAQAHDIAVEHGAEIYIHPPRYPSKRAFKASLNVAPVADYLDRNHHIVDCCEVLIAAPKTREEELRSGTWATVRYARKRGKTVIMLYPDNTERPSAVPPARASEDDRTP